MSSCACSQIAFEIAFKWTSFTGGENGLQSVERPLFTSAIPFHLFSLAVILGALWLLWRIAHSPFGRVMQALRDNEQRVASLGYDTYRTKLIALIISGGAIGVAGGLMALLLQGVYANNLNWQHAGDPFRKRPGGLTEPAHMQQAFTFRNVRRQWCIEFPHVVGGSQLAQARHQGC